jgi:hypothetical protein
VTDYIEALGVFLWGCTCTCIACALGVSGWSLAWAGNKLMTGSDWLMDYALQLADQKGVENK